MWKKSFKDTMVGVINSNKEVIFLTGSVCLLVKQHSSKGYGICGLWWNFQEISAMGLETCTIWGWLENGH